MCIYIYIYIYIVTEFEYCRYSSPGKRKPTSSLYVNQSILSRRLFLDCLEEGGISFFQTSKSDCHSTRRHIPQGFTTFSQKMCIECATQYVRGHGRNRYIPCSLLCYATLCGRRTLCRINKEASSWAKTVIY